MMSRASTTYVNAGTVIPVTNYWCFRPKGVMLAGGEMNDLWPWMPSIFSVQYFRLGSVSLVGFPGEFTIMAGRQVFRHIQTVVPDSHIILAGLTNNYINYVTTPQEYDTKNYEGVATIFGRNTVPVVTYWMTQMATAVVEVSSQMITPFCTSIK